MNRSRIVLCGLVILCGLAVAGSVLAANSYAISRDVFGSGGQPVAGGDIILDSTLGEPIAGPVTIEHGYGLRSGYWWPPDYYLYLPLVLKNM